MERAALGSPFVFCSIMLGLHPALRPSDALPRVGAKKKAP